jgi:hypothetical protein
MAAKKDIYVYVQVFHESFGVVHHIFIRNIFIDINMFDKKGEENPASVIFKDNQHIM